MPTAPHLPPTAHTSCREDRRRSRGQAISPNFSQIGCPLDATAILSAIPRCPRAAAREVVDELIADAGGVPEDARAWARATLGLHSEAETA